MNKELNYKSLKKKHTKSTNFDNSMTGNIGMGSNEPSLVCELRVF